VEGHWVGGVFGTKWVIEMKLNVYEAIVKRLRKEGAHPSMISVENVHAPYYRVER
jgi:hypothetical protein